ncbi:CFEM domain-containing protein [Aspergillus candidus]|uniref:CFEM domain-containing protein n=1 Tax=Aspergillus candidus TaxID=41067 RepID=A0A2I2FD74_ASPCN|nr:hypothetical protein BDW47DRAFT_24148 [Aspergillus candidus]PLB38578.1 hypothetical protein BDW47DRAFT_24148 [Aspergillus candidus]
MILRRILMLALLGLVAFVAAAEQLPQCAATCQKDTLADKTTSCSTKDLQCLCDDKKFQDAVETCVTAGCSGREALTAKRVSSHQCGVPPHKGHPEVEGATLVPLILAGILFVVRIAAKIMGLGGGWGPDDYTIIVAEILGIVVFALNVAMIHYGFGQNVWDVTPMDNITVVYKYFFAFVIIYKAQISLAKISVCLFLLRIFQSTAFRWTTYTIIGLNAAIAVTWMLTDSLRCLPVHLSWTAWQGEETGQCIDFMTVTFVNAFVNIAVDTAMVLMPVYEISKLNLSARKKAGVSVMFAMGLVLTVVAILRVIVFWFNRWGSNQLVELQPIVHWSVIEVQIAVLCACLPTTRAMVVHLFPCLVNGSGANSTQQPTAPSKMFGASRQPGNISMTVSYSVDYNSKPHQADQNSFVRLVEMDPIRDDSYP